MALGALHASVEIKRHPLHVLVAQPRQHQHAVQVTLRCHTVLVELTQHATHRRHTRKALESQHLEHERVVPIKVHVAQPPVTKQQMHDQALQEFAVTVKAPRPAFQAPAAPFQVRSKLQNLKELLENDETSK